MKSSAALVTSGLGLRCRPEAVLVFRATMRTTAFCPTMIELSRAESERGDRRRRNSHTRLGVPVGRTRRRTANRIHFAVLGTNRGDDQEERSEAHKINCRTAFVRFRGQGERDAVAAFDEERKCEQQEERVSSLSPESKEEEPRHDRGH